MVTANTPSTTRHSRIHSAFLPLLIASLVIVAAVPFGSVASWARSAVVGLSFLVTLTAAINGRLGRSSRSLLLLFGTLIAWFLLQCCPLPLPLLGVCQPYARALLEHTHAGRQTGRLCYDLALAQSTVLLWGAYALIAWTCAVALSRRRVSLLIGLLVGTGTLQAVWGILALNPSFDLFGLSPFSTDRAVGTFSSGNSFGGFMAISIVLTLGTALAVFPGQLESLRGPHRNKPQNGYAILWLPAIAFALLAQLVALALSASRGATVATACGVIVLLTWFFRTDSNRQRTGGHLLLASIGSLFLLGFGGTCLLALSRFRSLFAGDDVSAITRLRIWAESLRMLRAHPWGVGPGCFSEAFTRFQPHEIQATRVFHAHNDYLEIMCEWGTPGTLLLVLICIHMVRRARKRSETAKPRSWMWRGALVALLVAAIHSLVDFNISSRPGVAVLFVVLVGIALGGGTKRESRKRQPVRIHTWLAAPLIVLFLAGLTIQHLRVSAADAAAEGAIRSLGGAPNPYYWLNVSLPPPDEAVAQLERAARIAPFSSAIQTMLVRGRILDMHRRIRTVVDENCRNAPSASRSLIRSAVESGMAAERLVSLTTAQSDVADLLHIAPWSGSARAYQATIQASLVPLALSDNDRSRLLRSSLQTAHDAVALAPQDMHVLTVVCQALAILGRHNGEWSNQPEASSARVMLRKLGQQVLETGTQTKEDILRYWSQAGISAQDAIASLTLPRDVLWRMFHFYRKEDDSPMAQQVLATLDASCRSDGATSSVYYELSAKEQARTALANGNWDLYQSLSSRRREALRSSLLRQQPTLPTAFRSGDRMMFLALKRSRMNRGLDIESELAFTLLAHQQDDDRLATRLLGELAASTSDEQFSRIAPHLQDEGMTFWNEAGADLLRARLDMMHDNHAAAAEGLVAALDGNTVPLPIRHRIEFLLATCYARMGMQSKAEVTARRAADSCPNDPAALSFLLTRTPSEGDRIMWQDRLDAITPDIHVGMEFFGRRAILSGLRNTGNELLVYWQFNGAVPAGISAVVGFVGESGNMFAGKRHTFNASDPVRFAAGSPFVGGILVQRVPLTQATSASTSLLVGLQTSKPGAWRQSAAGLPFLLLQDWQTRVPHSLATPEKQGADR